MSFTRRPGSGRPRQSSHREDHHIVRNAGVQSTASSSAIQTQVAPSLRAPVSSRTIRRTFGIAAPITRAALDAHPSTPPFGVVPHTRSHFSTRQCSFSYDKGVTRLSPHSYYPSLTYPIPRFVSNRAYLGSFGTASWASHEFERTRGKFTANMERNVSRHHTELVCFNARSYRIVHSRWKVVEQGIKSSVLSPFSQMNDPSLIL
ncbi:transposable element Tcb1 transposase [Trichonephila clavipes]|nr:transposable element Tcb1 transposase [Trichonephila clavipes]